MAALDFHPEHLVLASLSPYFKEDLTERKLDKIDDWIGLRRLADFRTISFRQAADQIAPETRVHLLIGETENQQVWYTVRAANKRIANSELVVVPGVGHDIRQPEYQTAIKQVVDRL